MNSYKGKFLLVLLIFVVTLTACDKIDVSKLSDNDLERISAKIIVCEKPYIRHAADCCLDQNENNLCDIDETTIEPADNASQVSILKEENSSANFPSLSQVDHIIINSADWRDVYTGTQYANLQEIPNHFLVSTKHSTILLYSIPTTEKNILVLSSRERPFVVGYPDILRSRGYTESEEIRSSNMNLELLRQLQNVSRFIVVDDAYGYNAISVAPFAMVDRSFVIFANRNNIDTLIPVLQSKNPEMILVYGEVDSEVETALTSLNPEYLDKGDRFLNNIEIVKRYQAITHTKQVLLTNGEFIEASIMSGADPVLFLGRQNVPESVRAFIKDSNIEIGILMDNELVNNATFVRRQLGISVFVKYAQGARQPTGAIATVEDLDRFPTPS